MWLPAGGPIDRAIYADYLGCASVYLLIYINELSSNSGMQNPAQGYIIAMIEMIGSDHYVSPLIYHVTSLV